MIRLLFKLCIQVPVLKNHQLPTHQASAQNLPSPLHIQTYRSDSALASAANISQITLVRQIFALNSYTPGGKTFESFDQYRCVECKSKSRFGGNVLGKN
ncbi:hypothetical protein WAI453_004814 [Rhynchosporium graminicola]